MNYLIADGKSHWLEGVLLMMMYLIIALAAWYVYVSRLALSNSMLSPMLILMLMLTLF